MGPSIWTFSEFLGPFSWTLTEFSGHLTLTSLMFPGSSFWTSLTFPGPSRQTFLKHLAMASWPQLWVGGRASLPSKSGYTCHGDYWESGSGGFGYGTSYVWTEFPGPALDLAPWVHLIFSDAFSALVLGPILATPIKLGFLGLGLLSLPFSFAWNCSSFFLFYLDLKMVAFAVLSESSKLLWRSLAWV